MRPTRHRGICSRGTAMKVIEVAGTIEENRRVCLDEPLPAGVGGRVRLIILVGEDEPSEQEWLHAAARSGTFDFELQTSSVAPFAGDRITQCGGAVAPAALSWARAPGRVTPAPERCPRA